MNSTRLRVALITMMLSPLLASPNWQSPPPGPEYIRTSADPPIPLQRLLLAYESFQRCEVNDPYGLLEDLAPRE